MSVRLPVRATGEGAAPGSDRGRFSRMAVITTAGLTKRFGATRALVDLNLDVGAGEVFGFLGPNGAGKTTTIRLLMGLLHPTRGHARIFGLDAHRDAVAVHRRVGYLPSDPVLPLRLTARAFLAHLAHLRGGVPQAAIGRLVERLDLDPTRPIGALSRGNRQKVGIVQAFMHTPDLVVLDEASTGLDPLKQLTLGRLVRETAAAGRTVFLSSHVISEVEEVADRVGIIRQGHLVAVEDVDRLKERAVRRTVIRFAHPVDPAAFASLDGVERVETHDRTLMLVVTGRLDAVVKQASNHPVEAFTSEQADLTEVFLAYYRTEDARA